MEAVARLPLNLNDIYVAGYPRKRMPSLYKVLPEILTFQGVILNFKIFPPFLLYIH